MLESTWINWYSLIGVEEVNGLEKNEIFSGTYKIVSIEEENIVTLLYYDLKMSIYQYQVI